MNIVKKGKGPYIFYLNNKNKYFDLTSNANILGYSFKKLTTTVKNDISNRWRIKDYSIYHRRMEKLFLYIFSDKYQWMIVSSFKDFFFRLKNFFSISIHGDNLYKWWKINFNDEKSNCEKVNIIDMAYYYLYEENLGDIPPLSILNYYYYPSFDIKTMDSELIVLPEIFSGNFGYVNLLVKRGSLFEKIFDKPTEIESLIVSSSLRNYYLIKRYKDERIDNILNKDFFIQKKRIFVLKELNDKNLEYLRSKRIIVNKNPPFYNYLPIILEEHEIKYLKSIKMV